MVKSGLIRTLKGGPFNLMHLYLRILKNHLSFLYLLEDETTTTAESISSSGTRRRQSSSIDVRPSYQKKLSKRIGGLSKKSPNNKKLGFHNSKYFESGVSRYS